MEVLTIEQVKRQVLREYNRMPNGWQVLYGRNASRSFDTFVSNPTTVWHIKTDTIYGQNPLGIGVKIDDANLAESITLDELPYGFRPANVDLMMKLMGDLASLGHPSEETISLISSIQPTTYDKIKRQGVVAAITGPIIHSQSPLNIISDEHRRLNEKLESELRKMTGKRYRGMFV